MKTRRLYILSILGFLPMLFMIQASFRQSAAWAQEPDASYLATYPHSEAFDAVVQSHLSPAGKPPRELIYGTRFLDGNPRVAMECYVDMEGKGATATNIYQHAVQCVTPIRLYPARLKSLKSALPSLPPSSLQQSLDHLRILSYWSGQAWVTRLYDKDHLPTSVQKVYDMIGASVTSNSGHKD